MYLNKLGTNKYVEGRICNKLCRVQEFLSQNLKNKHTSEVKIIEDALKRNFPELQNKKSITKKRNFIQNELKKIKKQTQKLTR